MKVLYNLLMFRVSTNSVKYTHENPNIYETKLLHYYLPCVLDIVASLILYVSAIVDASSFATLAWKYPGCLGSGRAMSSLPSIATTSDVVGLSIAFSCTHSNAMLMHLIISTVQPFVANDISTSSGHLCSFHSFHAYENFHCRICNYISNNAIKINLHM